MHGEVTTKEDVSYSVRTNGRASSVGIMLKRTGTCAVHSASVLTKLQDDSAPPPPFFSDTVTCKACKRVELHTL
jgi:hypothetical protein